MELKLNIPDAVAGRVVDGIAGQYGWTAKLPDGSDNPEAKHQFAKRILVRWLKESVAAHESQVAAEQARKQAVQAAESEITIT